MEALSTTTSTHPVSSSTLRPKPFLSANPNNPLHLPPPPPSSSHASLPPFASYLSTKPGSSSLAPKPIPARSSLRSPLHPASKSTVHSTHFKAATGYAAALLDAAACDGALAAAAKDVRRFARAVRAVLESAEADEAVKGEVLTKVAEGGRFYGRLVALVRMLVRKGKVAVVGEVMEEFGRLWGGLCGRN